ncbi:MAG TPA: PadR family transcriptional regulator, partial [Mycobacterium sp.]|nr:PadR family transcriptional regulator [Mycobacterium sp.]
HLIAMAEAADAEIERLKQLRESVPCDEDDGTFYGLAALDHGLRSNAMQAEWARSVVRAIDERADAN